MDTELPRNPHIEITGNASIDVEPDFAKVVVELKDVADIAADGKQKVDTQSAAVIALAKQCDVGENDLTATQLRIEPEYDWRSEGNEYKGTSVSREVTITLRDLSRLGDLLQGLSEVPVFKLTRSELDSSERKVNERVALAEAITSAQNKAQDIAGGLDLKITGVFRVSDCDRYSGGAYLFADITAGGEGTAFEIGRINISAEVRVIFDIEPI